MTDAEKKIWTALHDAALILLSLNHTQGVSDEEYENAEQTLSKAIDASSYVLLGEG